MKTWLKIIALASLLGTLAGYLLVPQLVKVDQIRERITTQLGEKLGRPVEIESVRWHWLPLPHLSLYHSRLRYEAADLFLPETRLYPNWFSIFGSEVEVSKVVLKKPEITLKIRGDFSETLPEFTLPTVKVVIDDGTLHMQSLAPLFGVVTRTFDLSAISATARLAPGEVAFRLRAKSSFSKSLKMSGRYSLPDRRYSLETAWEELKLHQAIVSTGHGTLVPTDSTANLKASISGTGTEVISADLQGELPCFLYKPKNEKVLLDCGLVDLHLDKAGNDLTVAIRELEMEQPGLNLRGTVRRTVAAEDAEPVWQLDLAGRNLNVTNIRRTALTLFGDDAIVKDLFDIVRGGVAKKATYTFKGRAVDFEYLKYQVITAEAAEAVVHIPDANLTLEGVNGQMRIDGGVLHVSEASGRLGQSKGENCTLMFNLLDHIENPPFTLEVDIDAEATDLVRTLHELVPYEDFRRELLLLQNVEGRGAGHLHIGHTLQDFDVRVNVASMDVKGRYGRLAAPFHIQQGTMQFEPARLSFAGISGNLGNHRIHSLTGSVEWAQEPFLRIDNLDAALDGDTLLPALAHYKVVADYLAPVLSSLSGSLSLTRGSFQGPPLDHEKWRYSAHAILRNVGWRSPLLGNAPLTGHSGEVIVSDKEIALSRNTARLRKSTLSVEGVLRHQMLDGWQGELRLAGTLDAELGPWLRQRDWLPATALPRLPASISGVRLEWDDRKFAATGTLTAGGVSLQKPPQLSFDLKTSEQNSLILALDIADQERHGRLHLDLIDQTAETFRLAWQGELRAQSLKRLLADSSLLTGAVRGNCTITVPPDPELPGMSGQLNVTGLRLPLGEAGSQALAIRELTMNGSHGKAVIQRLLLGLNEQEHLAIKGEVTPAKGGLVLALQLASPHLTRTTANDFLDRLKELRDRTAAPEKSDRKRTGRTITGTVGFSLEKFISGPGDEGPAEEAPLVWSPIRGVLTLKPEGRMSAEIESARLCCLDAKGTWHSDPAMGVSHFSLATACPVPPTFEEVLPCLGIRQDLIQGEFALNADLFGELSFWHHGRLRVTSDKGRILRMRLLSKIFSIVNLTDLFTSDGFPNFEEKGFGYSELILETHIKDNELIIDKAVVRGEGLNLFARGKLNLGNRQADLTLMVAPFKTLDAIVGRVPLVGRIIGGKEAAIITIPVGIKGDIRDPDVTVLAPEAVGEGLLNLVRNTLLLPFNILSPILPKKGAGESP
ncbi:MAG: AsmA-like C-terminal domain-containing protein [Thermodesulfobacteriota bacterium]